MLARHELGHDGRVVHVGGAGVGLQGQEGGHNGGMAVSDRQAGRDGREGEGRGLALVGLAGAGGSCVSHVGRGGAEAVPREVWPGESRRQRQRGGKGGQGTNKGVSGAC